LHQKIENAMLPWQIPISQTAVAPRPQRSVLPPSSRSRTLDPTRNHDSRRPSCLLLRRSNDGASSYPNRLKMGADLFGVLKGAARCVGHHTATSHASSLAHLKPRGRVKGSKPLSPVCTYFWFRSSDVRRRARVRERKGAEITQWAADVVS